MNEQNDTEVTAAEIDQETTGPIRAADLDLALLKTMKKAQLIELCKALGLPADGKVAELRKRIRAKKLGGDNGHVHGKTLCNFCGHILRVTHTEPGKYRSVRCTNSECGYRGKIPWENTEKL